MWYMKLLWMVLTIGIFYLVYKALQWWNFFIDGGEQAPPKDRLRSITITYKPALINMTQIEIGHVVGKINEKLKKPYGSLSDQIDVDNVVSITTIPLPTKGVVQFTIWYREKYKRPKSVPYGSYNMGRTGGNAYTKDTKPFWS